MVTLVHDINVIINDVLGKIKLDLCVRHILGTNLMSIIGHVRVLSYGEVGLLVH